MERELVNPATYVLGCRNPGEMVGVMNAVMPKLSPEIRKKLNKITMRYFQLYGDEGLYDRVNNRTISTIISEYDWASDPKPIASGEIEGMRYELYDAPNAESDRAEESE